MPGGDHVYALTKLPLCTVLRTARHAKDLESVCGILPSADEVSSLDSLPVLSFMRRFIHVRLLNFNGVQAWYSCLQCLCTMLVSDKMTLLLRQASILTIPRFPSQR